MSYSLVDNRVVRDDGYIAMQHVNTNGKNVSIAGVTYVFVPSHNVSLAWIAPEHVDKALTFKTNACCGNQNKQAFTFASLINTYLWHGLDRNGNPK